jgi:hypothetical protein
MTQPDAGPLAASPGILARLRELATFVAPTTVATSLLFYFGYVTTRSRFDYFGVYLDMTDLSNQSLLLYGLEVIYVPAALAFLAVLAVVAIHGTVRWLLTSEGRDSASLLVALASALGGLLLIGRALVGMLVPGVEEVEFPGTTALMLATGPALVAYAGWIAGSVAARRTTGTRGREAGGVTRFAAWCAGDQASRLRRGALACVVGLAVAGLFWAVHEFAWAYGAGRAYDDAKLMPKRPGVVLEAKERLAALPPGISETPLAGANDQGFRYRYEGMRLLLASGGRLFLVPQDWTSASRTMVVTYDADVRIQLLPRR